MNIGGGGSSSGSGGIAGLGGNAGGGSGGAAASGSGGKGGCELMVPVLHCVSVINPDARVAQRRAVLSLDSRAQLLRSRTTVFVSEAVCAYSEVCDIFAAGGPACVSCGDDGRRTLMRTVNGVAHRRMRRLSLCRDLCTFLFRRHHPIWGTVRLPFVSAGSQSLCCQRDGFRPVRPNPTWDITATVSNPTITIAPIVCISEYRARLLVHERLRDAPNVTSRVTSSLTASRRSDSAALSADFESDSGCSSSSRDSAMLRRMTRTGLLVRSVSALRALGRGRGGLQRRRGDRQGRLGRLRQRRDDRWLRATGGSATGGSATGGTGRGRAIRRSPPSAPSRARTKSVFSSAAPAWLGEIAEVYVTVNPCAVWGPAVNSVRMRFDGAARIATRASRLCRRCPAISTRTSSPPPARACCRTSHDRRNLQLRRQRDAFFRVRIGTVCVGELLGSTISCEGTCVRRSLLNEPCSGSQPCAGGPNVHHQRDLRAEGRPRSGVRAFVDPESATAAATPSPMARASLICRSEPRAPARPSSARRPPIATGEAT